MYIMVQLTKPPVLVSLQTKQLVGLSEWWPTGVSDIQAVLTVAAAVGVALGSRMEGFWCTIDWPAAFR